MSSQLTKSVLEASISDLQQLLSTKALSSAELCFIYLTRIAAYDTRGPYLNSIPLINPNVFTEAAESDARRAEGQLLGPLDGIPYTLKDSYKYIGMTVAAGSPAFANLQPNENAHIAQQMKDAGAVMIGKTNMPPMACGGMQRGLYGRAESPYNSEYLTAAFSSGSSNGAATSTAASFASFGFGSETVSSGRSPASNNALVCYTPSKGVLSCRGLWPLYPTCDVPVPYARTVDDLLTILDVVSKPDPEVKGDFWREQTVVDIPKVQWPSEGLVTIRDKQALRGKRLAVPKMYIGGKDSHPQANHPILSDEVKQLWQRTKADLEDLGAICIETDFPLVTNYEDESTGRYNNVLDTPSDWHLKERFELVAYAWDDFLLQNKDETHKSLGDVNASLLFPLPEPYLPNHFVEKRNLLNYPALVDFINKGNRHGKIIFEIEGLSTSIKALETQRKLDLEHWMDANSFDAVVFPANGDVGPSDLEQNLESSKSALQNGVKYSNGNRVIRHLGIPTVNIPMGTMEEKKMPVNLTICGRAGEDVEVLRYAWAFEQGTGYRVQPPLTPELGTDRVEMYPRKMLGTTKSSDVQLEVLEAGKEVRGGRGVVCVRGMLKVPLYANLSVAVDGKIVEEEHVKMGEDGTWEVVAPYEVFDAGTPGYRRFEGGEVLAMKTMVVILAKTPDLAAKGLLVLL